MLKKFKGKFVATVIIVLTVVMLISIPVSAYEFNGENGGGTGNSSGISGTYGLPDTGMNAVGYRFSYVDYNGDKLKPSINLLASSYSQYKSGLPQAATTQWGYPYYNKIEIIRNTNAAINTVGFTSANGNAAASDFNVFGTGDMPYDVTKIKAYIMKESHLNSLCQYFGLSSSNNLQNGDKILIEPIFMMKMEAKQYCLTISELGLWGCAKWGADLPNSTGGGANSYGWIASYTNRGFPSALYSTDSTFWTPAYNAGTGGNSSTAVSYDENGNIGYGPANPLSNKGLIPFKYLISYGYGVGFVYNNTTPPVTETDIYPWSVALYTDENHTNLAASVDIKNNVQGCVYEGYTYYPVYSFYNETDRAVSAYVSAYTYYWGGYYDLETDGGIQYEYNNRPYLWKTFAAKGWQTIYGYPVTIEGNVVSEAQRDGGLKYWLSAKEDNNISPTDTVDNLIIPVVYKTDLSCWSVALYTDENHTNLAASVNADCCH